MPFFKRAKIPVSRLKSTLLLSVRLTEHKKASLAVLPALLALLGINFSLINKPRPAHLI